MVEYFTELEYYDVDIWNKIIETIKHKKKIANLHFFSCFWEKFSNMNKDPNNPFFKKMDDILDHMKKRHFNNDRNWRYNLEEGRWRTYDELVARREESKYEDFAIKKAELDQSVLDRAMAHEKRLKRLRLAKFSKDLFDEIVEEMLKEKRTPMEMMAELDVDEQALFES
jgi:hypothetical protein